MKTIIFGTKEIADLAMFYLQKDSNFDPVAFCEDEKYIKETTHNKLPVIAFENIEKEFPPNECNFFVPVYDNWLRKTKAEQVKEKNYRLISYISSKATCWSNSTIGENCFIMENNVIQPFVKIGNNVVLWSGNHIGHHSVIGNNVFFSSHVVLSGKCTVEEFAWLGVNSTIRDGITISEGTFLGMGSVVVKSTIPYKKYRGEPAKEYDDVAKIQTNL